MSDRREGQILLSSDSDETAGLLIGIRASQLIHFIVQADNLVLWDLASISHTMPL
jgi:hypothetical protein